MKHLQIEAPAAVYYHLNAAGEVLYIGCTVNPMARFEQHRGKSPWVYQVATIKVEWFPSIDAAYAEEQRQIEAIRPPMNRQVRNVSKSGQPRIGSAVLLRWMDENGIGIEALGQMLGYSHDYAVKLIGDKAFPHFNRRIDISIATKDFVPTWVWSSRDAEAISRIAPESAAIELQDWLNHRAGRLAAARVSA